MKVTVTDSVSGECIDSVLTEYSSYASIKTDTDTGKGYFREKRPGHNILELCDNSSPWGVSMLGVCVGLTNPLGQGSPEGLQWSKSFEISWLSCINVYYSFGRSDISFGLGFDWRNYKATTAGRRLVANDNKGIEWGEYPEGVTPKYSRLKVFSLQVPVLYRWSIPKSSLNLRIGPVLNFNTYASLLTVWDDPDGHKMEDFTKAISPRRFTVDFFGEPVIQQYSRLICEILPYEGYGCLPVCQFQSSHNWRDNRNLTQKQLFHWRGMQIKTFRAIFIDYIELKNT